LDVANSAGGDDQSDSWLNIPRQAKLTAAKLLDPLRQGDHCPGLSGLFAITNAIRLVLGGSYASSDRESIQIIAAGLRFLNGRLSPERAVTSALPFGLWLRLIDALGHFIHRRTARMVIAERVGPVILDREAAWMAIEQTILSGRPLLTLLQGGRYTVVSGFTHASLLLFDSSGAHWIAKSSTGIPGQRGEVKHILRPTSFVALRA
jgi:hypothetical protein